MKQHLNDITTLWARFGIIIRRMRIAKNISQEELAERAQLHRTYLTDVEHGKRNLSLESIRKIAIALDVSLSELFLEIEKAESQRMELITIHKRTHVEQQLAVEILVVEDDPSYVELTLHALRMGNVTNKIHVVRDGAEALEFFFANEPATTHEVNRIPKLVLLDLKLPKVDGIEVLEHIRSSPHTATIPVVVMTSSNDDVDFKRCLALGVHEYIVKPFNFEQFSRIMPLVGFHWLLLDKRKASNF
jgi:two-component system, response regulator